MAKRAGEVNFIKASSWTPESTLLTSYANKASSTTLADDAYLAASASISSPSGIKSARAKTDVEASFLALASKTPSGATDDLLTQTPSPPIARSSSEVRLQYRGWRMRAQDSGSEDSTTMNEVQRPPTGLSRSPFAQPGAHLPPPGPGALRIPEGSPTTSLLSTSPLPAGIVGAAAASPDTKKKMLASSNAADRRAQWLSQQLAQQDSGVAANSNTIGPVQGGSYGHVKSPPTAESLLNVFKKARSYQALDDLEKTGYFPAAPKPSAAGVQRGLKDSVVNDMCRAIVKHMVGDVYVASSGQYGSKKVLNHLYEPVLKSVQSHFRRLPARYALSVDPDDVPMHMRLLSKHHRNPEDINMTVQVKKDDDGNVRENICEVVVVSDDRDSLLDAITRALTSMKGSILDADVMTTVDGVTLDRFVVKGDFLSDERQQKLKKRIEANLTRVNFVEEASPSPQTSMMPPTTEFIPKESEENLADVVKMVDKNDVKDEWRLKMSEIKLDKTIGSGRSGNTYRAYWRGTQVAAKIVDMTAQNSALSEDLRNEFHREVAVVSMLRHPNIVLFLGAAVEPPKYCLVFEFMENGTLTDLIRARRNPIDFFQIATEISMGMNYLHLCSIMHRDLKSGNVLLDSHGTVKISDFGLSTVLVMGQSRDLTAETGTYRWMAPEVIRHEPYSTKADVYSFGVILWELIAKDQPFRGLTPIQAAFAVARQQMRPALPRQTPVKIGELVEHCWHQDPNKRPDFSAILEALPLVKRSLKKRDFKNLGFTLP